MKINWYELPYSHKEWQQKYTSIFNPTGKKISFPHYVAEMLLFNRSKILKNFPIIIKGEGWTNAIQDQYRKAVQQAYTICNYFPSIESEPLVEMAFRNVFRNNRILSIGQYRKIRVTKAGKLNITQAEKDCVLAISTELERLTKQRVTYSEVKTTESTPTNPSTVKFGGSNTPTKKKSLAAILALEKQIKQ
jgi:hypothetical protein